MEESELRSVPLFDSLTSEERRLIARYADEIDAPEGTELDGKHVADLGPGDFLGEMGIVAKPVRNATVVTTSPARLIVMTGQALRSMARLNPAVADRIRAAVEERCPALLS